MLMPCYCDANAAAHVLMKAPATEPFGSKCSLIILPKRLLLLFRTWRVGRYIAVTLPLHCRHIAVTWPSHGRHMNVTLLRWFPHVAQASGMVGGKGHGGGAWWRGMVHHRGKPRAVAGQVGCWCGAASGVARPRGCAVCEGGVKGV